MVQRGKGIRNGRERVCSDFNGGGIDNGSANFSYFSWQY